MGSERIVICSGEPAGIGPEITLQALQTDMACSPAVVGDAELLRRRAQLLGLDMDLCVLSDPGDVKPHRPGRVQVLPVNLGRPSTAGKLNPGNSQYVIDTINLGVDLCLEHHYRAMVTAPVNKGAINDAGINFCGHTEWIAERTRSNQPVMMLTNDALKVCLATTHVPLRRVAETVGAADIRSILEVMDSELRRLYAIENPVIGVCGLNPHAGENGHLGTEEMTVIEPVLNELRKQGLHLTGPIPADTAFTKNSLKSLDAVLAMYHDQGLPVIKHSGFGEVVNVTLGLPIIRTSVDHGTALDLAGSGRASEASLLAAIRLAVRFAQNT